MAKLLVKLFCGVSLLTIILGSSAKNTPKPKEVSSINKCHKYTTKNKKIIDICFFEGKKQIDSSKYPVGADTAVIHGTLPPVEVNYTNCCGKTQKVDFSYDKKIKATEIKGFNIGNKKHKLAIYWKDDTVHVKNI